MAGRLTAFACGLFTETEHRSTR